MDRFRPVARGQTLPEQVADLLEEHILTAQLQPGDRLPSESELTAALKVSRSVVREAFSRLKHEGLVDTKVGVGAFVTDKRRVVHIDDADLDGEQSMQLVYEIRMTIEPNVAALAARRRTAVDVTRIEGALRKLMQSETTAEFLAAEQQLGGSIAAATGNPYFIGIVDFVRSKYLEAWRASGVNGSVDLERAKAELAGTVEAVTNGDDRAARSLCLKHLRAAAARTGMTHRADEKALRA